MVAGSVDNFGVIVFSCNWISFIIFNPTHPVLKMGTKKHPLTKAGAGETTQEQYTTQRKIGNKKTEGTTHEKY